MQELIREGVFTSAVWEALPLPAEGYLMDVLLANVAKIAEEPWIDWLIRKHHCTRIPGLEPAASFIKSIDRKILNDCIKYDCYPQLVGENHLVIGIGRPDYPDHLPALRNHFQKKVFYRNALSINEIKRLRQLAGAALETM